MHFALLTWPNSGPVPDLFPHAVAPPARRTSTAATLCAPLRRTLASLDARLAIAWLAALAGLLLPLGGWAAGGHHAVDDAAILEPGQCHLEAWAEAAGGHRLQHLGPACHVLGVEAGLSLEHDAVGVQGAGLHLKWARALQPGLDVGLVWAAGWQSGETRFAGQTLLLPLSWVPHDDLVLHLNLGREFRPHGADVGRYGAALEWRVAPRWQALAEGWRDARGPQRRLGLRYAAGERVSVDLSRAQAQAASRSAWWTLGLNWAVGR
ncbi:MAG: hypothetical protein GXC94_12475 [Comamonadaceae bacterium]|nr:hypothetical protein [Comamonadaceae bacterium]